MLFQRQGDKMEKKSKKGMALPKVAIALLVILLIFILASQIPELKQTIIDILRALSGK